LQAMNKLSTPKKVSMNLFAVKVVVKHAKRIKNKSNQVLDLNLGQETNLVETNTIIGAIDRRTKNEG